MLPVDFKKTLTLPPLQLPVMCLLCCIRFVHHSCIIKITGHSYRIKGKLFYEENNVKY